MDASLWNMCLAGLSMCGTAFSQTLCLIGVRSHGENVDENQPVTEVNPFITVFPISPFLRGILKFLEEGRRVVKIATSYPI